MKSGRIIYLVEGLSSLGRTRQGREVLYLSGAGLVFTIFGLRRKIPPRRLIQYDLRHEEIHHIARIRLPRYPFISPLRLHQAWRKARQKPGYRKARANWWAVLSETPNFRQFNLFAQAIFLAEAVPEDSLTIHADFMEGPGQLASYAALLTGLPWSFSAHTSDIWSLSDREKSRMLHHASWGTASNQAIADHLNTIATKAEITAKPGAGAVESGTQACPVTAIYHGVDLTAFPAPAEGDIAAGHGRRSRDGRDPHDPVVILAAGRAIPRKGYGLLISALASLPKSLNWRLVHIGGGPQQQRLIAQAKASGINQRITWMGRQPQDILLDQYRVADFLVAPSMITPEGRFDGLPDTILEAQSQALPSIASNVGAIAEAIENGVTGVLFESGSRHKLVSALEAMIRDPSWRTGIGEAAARNIKENFDREDQLERLAGLFRQPDESPADEETTNEEPPGEG